MPLRQPLQSLRQARALAFGVLAWFVLSLGVAIASPVVRPQALTLVCSAAGAVKLVAGNDEGTAASASHHALDCVLCLALGAPPADTIGLQTPLLAPALALAYAPAAFVPWRSAAPLPARGPPAA